jgi:hypothetical protein
MQEQISSMLPVCHFWIPKQNLGMSATEATAEIFVTAFKSLKRRECEAILEHLLADEELSEDLADTLNLEARRHQPRESFRKTLMELKVRA